MSRGNQLCVAIPIGSSRCRPVEAQRGSVLGQADKVGGVGLTQDGRREGADPHSGDYKRAVIHGDLARLDRLKLGVEPDLGCRVLGAQTTML